MVKEIFSETESKVLKTIGSRQITIAELTAKYYRGKMIPVNPKNVVAGTIRRINQKCEYHKLDWFINGAGLGRGGRTVWKDKKA